jgi:hypothetical protein
MTSEDTTKPDEALFEADTEASPDPDHDAWFRREVEATLAGKTRGEGSYRPLEAVMREFTSHARSRLT